MVFIDRKPSSRLWNWPALIVPIVAAFLAALVSTAANAQEDPPCPRNVSVTGNPCTAILRSTDPEVDGTRYHEYAISLGQGQSVQIAMESEQVDSALEIYGAEGDAPEASNNDARPNVLHARVYFFPQEAGTYRIRARGGFGQVGRYTLTVSNLPAAPPPTRLPAPFEVVASFGDAAPVLAEPITLLPVRYALYSYRGQAGERLQVEMLSGEMDSMLELTAVDDPSFSVMNGYWANTRNARLLAVLPSTGEYVIRAMAPVEQPGAYRIRLRSLPAPPPEQAEPLRLDQPLTRELGLASGMSVDPSFRQIEFLYETFTLEVVEGIAVTVDLSSEYFDPVLDAGIDSPIGFAIAAIDDDGGDGLDSRLTLHPTATGPITLRARALGLGRGEFTIRATTSPVPEPNPDPTSD